MRIEGQHHAGAAALGGAALDALDDLDVAAMQAVEVAERQHRLMPARAARIVGKVDDLHVSSSVRYDHTVDMRARERPRRCHAAHHRRAPPGGSAALVAACGRSWQMWVK